MVGYWNGMILTEILSQTVIESNLQESGLVRRELLSIPKLNEYYKCTADINNDRFSNTYGVIGDNTVTSSTRIAQVFPDLVGKKTRALWKVYRGMLKYIINYALYLAHCMHNFK